MMFGGYVWGSMADISGRRKVIIYSLAVNGLFGLASAFAQSYWLLLLLRFLSGFGYANDYFELLLNLNFVTC